MEKSLFVLFIFVILQFPVFCHAQEEVFPTGTVWKEVKVDEGMVVFMHTPPDTTYARTYEIGVDTVIGDNTYKRVMMDGVFTGNCIREKDNCVWMISELYPNEFKLYDFNWGGVESVNVQYLRATGRQVLAPVLKEEKLLLEGIETFTVSEGSTQKLHLSDRTILRGIGSVSDLNRNSCLLGYLLPQEILPAIIYTEVLWLRRNGQLVYDNRSIASAMEVVKESSTGRPSISVYNLHGHRVTGSPRPGIYIENGRKRVVGR